MIQRGQASCLSLNGAVLMLMDTDGGHPPKRLANDFLSTYLLGHYFKMPMRFVLLLAMLAAICAGCSKSSPPPNLPQVSKMSPKAPPDQPYEANGKSEVGDYRVAIAPYVEKGRQTYPAAKKRYLAGLPQGDNFFVVTNLRDHSRAIEQVFVAVAEIKGDQIIGRIASDILVVKDFKKGDPYTFSERVNSGLRLVAPIRMEAQDGCDRGQIPRRTAQGTFLR